MFTPKLGIWSHLIHSFLSVLTCNPNRRRRHAADWAAVPVLFCLHLRHLCFSDSRFSSLREKNKSCQVSLSRVCKLLDHKQESHDGQAQTRTEALHNKGYRHRQPNYRGDNTQGLIVIYLRCWHTFNRESESICLIIDQQTIQER